MDNCVNHSDRSHALLSASSASRWLNCTPSARLEQKYGENESSVYAREGTLAHELAELFIRRDILNDIDDASFESRLEELRSDEMFGSEMLDMVSVYTKYCDNEYTAAQSDYTPAIMEIEQRLDLSMFVPESFGTADCIIIADGNMEIIDLKYGKGVPVYAESNKQLMLYGLGALEKYGMLYDIRQVLLTIVQPRLNNISTWQISAADLNKWANEELKPVAQLAFNGAGELNAGNWCRFCAIRNRCRKLYDKQMEIAQHEFAKPELLADDEIADIIKRGPKFTEWLNSVTEYAQAKAVSGEKSWPGFKLVEGISRRKWLDESRAASTILKRCPELSEDEIFSIKLNSVSVIEKLVGKKRFSALLGDTVIKPQGKLCLVPDDDKRPAMGGYAQAKMDFKE